MSWRLVSSHEIVLSEGTALAHRSILRAGVRAAAPRLVPDDVTLLTDDHVVSGLSEDARRYLVCHRP